MKILLTGANGYVGAKLLPLLLESGHEVFALVRNASNFTKPDVDTNRLHVIEGDLLEIESLKCIPEDLDAAYFLVHSMSQSISEFESLEKTCAENFIQALEERNVSQIIYLSGLVNEKQLSPHLTSRRAVETILTKSRIPSTVLRAGIIIGSGSASFEIMRDLVELLPVMVAPKWVFSKCQPIGIDDVLTYLIKVLGNPLCFNHSFDIGGPDTLSYLEMLYIYAEVRGLYRLIITVPVLTPRLSSYWLYFITSTKFSLAYSLVDSLKCDAVCVDTTIKKTIPLNCLTYRESLEKTLSHYNHTSVPIFGCLKDEKKIPIDGNPEDVLNKIWSIGGKNGWYYMHWAWVLRGWVDRLFGGIGLSKGRTDPKNLKNGDTLDFWRVIDANKEKKHLLLFAEMKIPGEAWLEFKLNKENGTYYLIQNATFRPKGILGRVYWYALLPFHHLIFIGMAKAIAQGNLKP